MDSKEYRTQLATVCHAFKFEPLTMLQVAYGTGIERAGICWYVRILRKAKKIALVKIDYCPITKHKAGFYTTDTNQFPVDNQTNLFE